MAIKAEMLQSILSDADTAKPIKGMKCSYTPVEYNKLAAKQRAMGLINDGANGGLYEVHIDEGEVEFDENGNLKAIGRTRPMMLDLNRYCANRYLVQRVPNAPTAKAKGVKELGTYILAVFGEAVVSAISSAAELPPSVRAYRFIKRTREIEIATTEQLKVLKKTGQVADTAKIGDKYKQTSWDYVCDEFVTRDVVYTMTEKLNNDAALKLLEKLHEARADSAEGTIEGKSLDDIE